jgi:hypothetical protein
VNNTSFKAVCIKAVTAAGLFAAAWVLTVKPASASLADRNNLLEAQTLAINDFTARTATTDTTAATLEKLTAHARHFADRITRHPTDSGVYDAVESAASAHGVSVHRTEPRPVPRRPRSSLKPSSTAAVSGVTEAVFTIELSGTYGSIVAFLDTLGETLGLARVVDIRLAASAGDDVRGVVGLAVYRVPPTAIIIPDPQEAGEDDA